MREAKAKMSHFLAIIEYAYFFCFILCFLVFSLCKPKKGGKMLERSWKDTGKGLERELQGATKG